MVKACMIYERVRWEEKSIINEAAKRRDIEVKPINLREVVFKLGEKSIDEYDVYLQRSISFFKGLFSTAILEGEGCRVINSFETSLICGNKLLTTLKLIEKKIPTPKTMIAFSEESALRAVDEVGYPSILKPIYGSWGRLVAPLKDPMSAKAIIEARSLLHPIHQVYYVQEMVDRPPRDIRAFVVGEEVVAAIYRVAPEREWRTNTSLGGRAEKCPVTGELEDLSLRAAEAVGGGILGVDLMETPNGLVVHEVNHVIEFRNTVPATGVNIPKFIVDYMVEACKK